MKVRSSYLFILLFLLSACAGQRPSRPSPSIAGEFQNEAVRGNTIRHHDLTLHLESSSGQMLVEDEIEISVVAADVKLYLHREMQIESIAYQDQPLQHAVVGTDKEERNTVAVRLPEESIGKTVKITAKYRGGFPSIDFSDARHRGTEVRAYINKDAALLLSNAHWYPRIPEQTALITYDLKVFAPAGQEVISAGERIPPGGFFSKREYTRFRMRRPTDEINLVSGPYHVKKQQAESIALYTFFTKEDPELEKIYFEAMKAHLKTFQERFGPYPYETMSVVATPLMEGLGFPGFTLIGERLLRIPNLPQTSLGHEILHNWFGNGVYVDIDQGNWSEGLVTYLIDHQFSIERQGGAAARRGLLELYSIYTRSGPEPGLTDFQERETPEQMAVGYEKGAFVFGMLERRLGRDRFDQALRRLAKERMFLAASWRDLQSVFESASGGSLDEFFRQWIYGSGAPTLRIEKANLSPDQHEASLTLISEPPFRYEVPIEIKTEGETITTVVAVNSSPQTVTLKAPSTIQAVTVDPDYIVLRKLLPKELPTTIASVLETDAELPVVFSEALGKEEREIYEYFLDVSEIRYREIQTVEEAEGPTLLMGPPSETGEIGGWSPQEVPWKWEGRSLTIGSATVAGGKEAAVLAWRGPKGSDQPVVWIVGYSRDGFGSLAMRLGYFTASSYVLLREGKQPFRGEWKSNERPLHVSFPRG